MKKPFKSQAALLDHTIDSHPDVATKLRAILPLVRGRAKSKRAGKTYHCTQCDSGPFKLLEDLVLHTKRKHAAEDVRPGLITPAIPSRYVEPTRTCIFCRDLTFVTFSALQDHISEMHMAPEPTRRQSSHTEMGMSLSPSQAYSLPQDDDDIEDVVLVTGLRDRQLKNNDNGSVASTCKDDNGSEIVQYRPQDRFKHAIAR